MQVWHHAEKFLTKHQKKFALCMEMKIIFFKKRLLYLRMFLCESRNQFWQPRRKLLTRGSKISTQLPTLLKKLQSFSKHSFFKKSSFDRWTAVSTIRPVFFRQKTEDFMLNLRKFWTKSRKSFAQYLKVERVCFSFKKICFSSNAFYGQVERSLRYPVEKFRTKGRKNLVECHEMIRNAFL